MRVKERILSAKLATGTVTAFGEELQLLEMDGVVFEEFAAELEKVAGDRCRAACIAVYSVVDADGNFMFSVDDIPMLSRKSWRELSRISKEVDKLSGLSGDDPGN